MNNRVAFSNKNAYIKCDVIFLKWFIKYTEKQLISKFKKAIGDKEKNQYVYANYDGIENNYKDICIVKKIYNIVKVSNLIEWALFAEAGIEFHMVIAINK